jgi:hypothetical protein
MKKEQYLNTIQGREVTPAALFAASAIKLDIECLQDGVREAQTVAAANFSTIKHGFTLNRELGFTAGQALRHCSPASVYAAASLIKQ